MSHKYNTKQNVSAQYCDKQTSEIWCKNIQAFLRYSNFSVGIFYFASPCIRHGRGSIFCNLTQPNPWLYRPNSTHPKTYVVTRDPTQPNPTSNSSIM